ncbi:DAK2 domain-containing protein [Nocardia sp. NPDC050408]|uniref:DAK2 domain-containing protein n=1 Tax=Nocardia sp. NPDC050408 TaxID=3364319 RepID=UPI0037A4CCB7
MAVPGVRDMMGDGPDAGLPAVAGPNELNGTGLLRWGRICLEGLQQRREEINALNVFPIADADTGTNMLATMRAAMQAADAAVISARGSERSDGAATEGVAADGDAVAGTAVSDARAVSGFAAVAGTIGGAPVSDTPTTSPEEFANRVIATNGIDRRGLSDSAARGSSRNGPSAALWGATADGYPDSSESLSTHDVAVAMARGATLGARGNSGIILSQVLRGIAEAVRGGPLTAQTLRDALATASALVRESLSVPVEGTILTVLDRAAECAAACSESALAEVAVAAADGAAKALGDTPAQLGVLRRAGVVDAGARGLVVLLDSLVALTLGETPARPGYARGEFVFAGDQAGADRGTLAAQAGSALRADAEPYGSCAESLNSADLNSAEPHFEVMYLLSDTDDQRIAHLRDRLADLGDSVVVVGDGAGSWSAHVHCADAGAAVEAGIATGTLSAIRIESFTTDAARALAADRTDAAVRPVHVGRAAPSPRAAASGHHDAAPTGEAGGHHDAARTGEAGGHSDTDPANATGRVDAGARLGGTGHAVPSAHVDGGVHRDSAPADKADRTDARGHRDSAPADLVDPADVAAQPGSAGRTDATARVQFSGVSIRSGVATHTGSDHEGPADRAVLAVASGDGAAALFEAGGAVVLGGDGRVTSAALLAAIRQLPNREVLVLPNGALPAHELVAVGVAARDAHRDVLLLPSGSMVQGLAALAVHDCGRIAVDDAFAMSEAAAATRWGSLRAATERALTMVGTCEAGDGLGLVGHDVVVIDRDAPSAGRTLLDRMLAFGGELVTLLMGVAAPAELADELAGHIANGFPGVEVSVYFGGQQADLVQIGVE